MPTSTAIPSDSVTVSLENGRLVGNFPQAVPHLGLIDSVSILARRTPTVLTYLAQALEPDRDVTSDRFDPERIETPFRRGDSPDR